MKRNRRLLIFILIYLILLAACKGENERDNSWVLELRCGINCWNGIVLGESTAQETLALLSSNDHVDKDSIVDLPSPWKIFSGNTLFQFNESSLDGNVVYMNNRVSHVFIQNLDSGVNIGELGVVVGDVIDKFGAPVYVFRTEGFAPTALFPDTSHTFVWLVSPGSGYAIKYDEDILSGKQDGEISPEIELYTIVLFFPGDLDLLIENEFLDVFINFEDLNDAFDWKGYGLYPRDS